MPYRSGSELAVQKQDAPECCRNRSGVDARVALRLPEHDEEDSHLRACPTASRACHFLCNISSGNEAQPLSWPRRIAARGAHARHLRSVQFAQSPGSGQLWRQSADAEFRPFRAAGGHLRHPLRRQPSLHAGAPRHPHRAARTSRTAAGDRSSRSTIPSPRSSSSTAFTRISSPTTGTISRRAAPPTTRATRPGTSSAARRTIPGRRWCSRRSSGSGKNSTRSTTGSGRRSMLRRACALQHAINKEYMREEKDYPGPRCFAAGLEFLEANRSADGWFLQIECFDPHEPFDAPAAFPPGLRHRLEGRRAELALLREGHRQRRGDRRDQGQLRGAGRHVRRLFRPAARLHGRARACGRTPR